MLVQPPKEHQLYSITGFSAATLERAGALHCNRWDSPGGCLILLLHLSGIFIIFMYSFPLYARRQYTVVNAVIVAVVAAVIHVAPFGVVRF